MSSHQQAEWKPKCLSYKEVPFDQPGLLGGLFHINQGTVFSASEEVDECPFCNACSIVASSEGKEVSLFTQYQRATVQGEIPLLYRCNDQIDPTFKNIMHSFRSFVIVGFYHSFFNLPT